MVVERIVVVRFTRRALVFLQRFDLLESMIGHFRAGIVEVLCGDHFHINLALADDFGGSLRRQVFGCGVEDVCFAGSRGLRHGKHTDELPIIGLWRQRGLHGGDRSANG